MVSGENIFAGTNVGVFHSNDEGQTWTISNSGLLNLNIQFLAIVPNGLGGNNLLAGSWGSGVFLSTNNGISWFPSNTGMTNSLAGCVMVSDTNLFVGTNCGLFLSTNYGRNWSLVDSGLVHFPGDSLSITCLALSEVIYLQEHLAVGFFYPLIMVRVGHPSIPEYRAITA